MDSLPFRVFRGATRDVARRFLPRMPFDQVELAHLQHQPLGFPGLDGQGVHELAPGVGQATARLEPPRVILDHRAVNSMERADAIGNFTADIFVTEKVRQAFVQAKIKNLTFDALSDSSVGTDVFEITRSYQLPRDFSQRIDAAYARAGVRRPGQC